MEINLSIAWSDFIVAVGVYWFWVLMAVGAVYLIFKAAASAVFSTKLDYMRRLIHGKKG